MLTYTEFHSARDFDDAITSGSKTYIKITFMNQNVPGDKIVFTEDNISENGLEITSYFNTEENVTFGNLLANEVIIHFINSSDFDNLDWTQEFKIEFGVDYSSTKIGWTTVGRFEGKKPKIYVGSPEIEFIAYNRIYYFDKNEIANKNDYGPFPQSYKTFMGDVLSQADFYRSKHIKPLNYFDNNQMSSYIFEDGVSLADIISWFAEANCANFIFKNGGDSTILEGYGFYNFNMSSAYSPSVYLAKYSNIYNISIEDETIPVIDTINISTSDGLVDFTYPTGSTGRTYKIVDNPFLTALSDADKATVCSQMITQFAKVSNYKPMTVEIDGGILIEPGDVVLVEQEDGTTLYLPVFKKVFTWNGSCRCIYESTGNIDNGLTKEQLNEYRLDGVINSKVGSKIVNNTTTTTEGYALDARQGKILNDKIEAHHIFLQSTDNTWAKIWEKISVLSTGETATILINQTPMALISGNARNVHMTGVIGRTSTTAFNFLLKDASNYIYSARITNVSSSSAGTYTEQFFNIDDINAEIAKHHIALTSSDDTWSKIWTKISALSTNESATLYSVSAAMKIISSDARYGTVYVGLIVRTSASAFQFLFKNSSNNIYVANLTGCSSSTPGTYAEVAFDDSTIVHKTGTENIDGAKTFKSSVYIKNSTRPIILLQSENLGKASGGIRGWNAENPSGKYGQTQIDFVEYSPSADGTSLSNNYEAYKLPAVDVDRSGSEAFEILTTKTAPTFKKLTAAVGATNFTLAKSSRIRIDFITTNAGRLGYAIVSTSSGGTVYLKSDVGSNLTLATSANTLTVTAAGAAAVLYCTIYEGDIS